jgi:hypothetical protein
LQEEYRELKLYEENTMQGFDDVATKLEEVRGKVVALIEEHRVDRCTLIDIASQNVPLGFVTSRTLLSLNLCIFPLAMLGCFPLPFTSDLAQPTADLA